MSGSRGQAPGKRRWLRVGQLLNELLGGTSHFCLSYNSCVKGQRNVIINTRQSRELPASPNTGPSSMCSALPRRPHKLPRQTDGKAVCLSWGRPRHPAKYPRPLRGPGEGAWKRQRHYLFPEVSRITEKKPHLELEDTETPPFADVENETAGHGGSDTFALSPSPPHASRAGLSPGNGWQVSCSERDLGPRSPLQGPSPPHPREAWPPPRTRVGSGHRAGQDSTPGRRKRPGDRGRVCPARPRAARAPRHVAFIFAPAFPPQADPRVGGKGRARWGGGVPGSPPALCWGAHRLRARAPGEAGIGDLGSGGLSPAPGEGDLPKGGTRPPPSPRPPGADT